MDVEDFEKIKFNDERTVEIKRKLPKLYYNDFGRNVPANTKVCFVQFENFGNNKIKIIEESLGRFFRKYGIGPFYTLPKLTIVGRCYLGAIFALCPTVLLLGLFFLCVLSPRSYNSCMDTCVLESKDGWCKWGCRWDKFMWTLASAGTLAGGICLTCLMSCIILNTNICKHIRRFSEKEDAATEEGIFFVIDNELLEKCWRELEKMNLQVEVVSEEGIHCLDKVFCTECGEIASCCPGKVLCKFTSPTDSLPIGDYELRAIEVVDEEREDSSE